MMLNIFLLDRNEILAAIQIRQNLCLHFYQFAFQNYEKAVNHGKIQRKNLSS